MRQLPCNKNMMILMYKLLALTGPKIYYYHDILNKLVVLILCKNKKLAFSVLLMSVIIPQHFIQYVIEIYNRFQKILT